MFKNFRHCKWVYFLAENAFLYKRWNQVERRVQRRAFFSHGRTNSCGVAINFYGSKTIEQKNKISDKSERIILVEETIEDKVLVTATRNLFRFSKYFKQNKRYSKQKQSLWRGL